MNRPLIRSRASEHAALSKRLNFTPIETRDDNTSERLVVVGEDWCIEHLGRLRTNSISFDLILI